jgi:hypothetical protein
MLPACSLLVEKIGWCSATISAACGGGAELLREPGGLLVVDDPALGHVGVEADDRRERRS